MINEKSPQRAFDLLADELQKRTVALKKRMESTNAGNVVVKIDQNARYPNGTSVASVARLIEYGTRNKEPRPFMRTALMEGRAKWRRKIVDACKKELEEGDGKYQQTLLGIGQEIRESIQESVERFGAVDTGRLKGSIIVEVEGAK